MNQIKGKVVYQNVATGCWGIIDDEGKEWRPVNMPEQLKKVGAKVSVRVRKVPENISIFMWGEPVEILSFHTLYT